MKTLVPFVPNVVNSGAVAASLNPTTSQGSLGAYKVCGAQHDKAQHLFD